MSTVAILKALDIGTEYYFNMFQDGGAKVVRTLNGYDLYEIPLYSGEELYNQSFYLGQEQELLDLAYSWS